MGRASTMIRAYFATIEFAKNICGGSICGKTGNMIPYSTDAPLYHWPIATAALILLNALLYVAVPSSWLESHAPQGQRAPAAFKPLGEPDVVEDDQQDTAHVAQDAEWGAGAFRIVEEPPTVDDASTEEEVSSRQPLPPEGALVDNAPQPAEGSAEGKQAAEDPEVDRRRRPQAKTPLTLMLALELGVGIRPWQWITKLFFHAGWVSGLLSLLGLWAFGLVVEGKVGARMMLVIYLGIGVAQAALEQSVMLWGAPSVSMGANAALLGLLGVAVVWAPRNEFEVLWGFGPRGGSIEIPVLMFGFIQLAMELIGVASGGLGITSSLMHLSGLAMGFAVGTVWLRRGWVDCEGWDLFSVWRHGRETDPSRDEVEAEARALVRASRRDRDGRPARTAAQTMAGSLPVASRTANVSQRAAAKAVPKTAPKVARGGKVTKKATPATSEAALPLGQQRLQIIQRAIAENNVPVALKLYAKLQVSHPEVQLPQAALFGLIKAMLKAQDFHRAIPFLREHIARFSEQRIALQFNLAQLLIYLQQPRKALEVLHATQSNRLDSAQRATWQDLAHHAQHQIDEGILEVSE